MPSVFVMRAEPTATPATVVSSGTGSCRSPASSCSTGLTGISVGDLLLTFAHHYTSGGVTPPAGWSTEFALAGQYKQLTAFSRTADASDVGSPSYTWTNGDTTPMNVLTVSCRKAGASVLTYDYIEDDGTGHVPHAPSVTSPITSTLLLGIFTTSNGTFASGTPAAISVPTGMTSVVQFGANQVRMLAASEVAPSGATGLKTSSAPYDPAYCYGISVLIG
jgi:hypothetical protein